MASEQDIILFLIQSCIEYLKEVYPNFSEEVLDDLIDLFDDVLQYFSNCGLHVSALISKFRRVIGSTYFQQGK